MSVSAVRRWIALPFLCLLVVISLFIWLVLTILSSLMSVFESGTRRAAERQTKITNGVLGWLDRGL